MTTPDREDLLRQKLAPNALSAALKPDGAFVAVLPTGEKRRWEPGQVNAALKETPAPNEPPSPSAAPKKPTRKKARK